MVRLRCGRARWAGVRPLLHLRFDRAIAAANIAMEEAREAGEEVTQGRRLHVLAVATFMVDPGASRLLFTSSLELARASGDRRPKLTACSSCVSAT